MQPNPLPKIYRHPPFIFAFILSLLFTTLWTIFFILAVNSCGNNCYKNDLYYLPCLKGGTLYCCSPYSETSRYQCAGFNNCNIDNTNCGGYTIVAWIFGGLMIIVEVSMIVVACRFVKMKKQLLAQGGYQNMNTIPNNGFGSGQIIYADPAYQRYNMPYQQPYQQPYQNNIIYRPNEVNQVPVANQTNPIKQNAQ